MNQENKEIRTDKNWYDRNYKLILLVPLLIFTVSIVYLGIFYAENGDILYRDSSLAGGTTITLNAQNIEMSATELENLLKDEVSDVRVRDISDLTSGKRIALIIDSSVSPEELQASVEKDLGYELTEENSSTEFTGPSLSEDFYKQLIRALVFSFILMSIVIFIMFRSFIPSIAVIFAAFADIVMPLAILNFFGVKLSAAGIAAFLMLIGYSVDTDILLTTRVLKKREGTVNERIYGSFKTGMFMTGTALIAVLPAFFLVTGLPDSFKQIFLILAIGLVADIMNTWMTNTGIIKWYANRKGLK